MTTMTSKGQVTIPKRMRDALGLKPGNNVEFALEPDGRVVLLVPKKRKMTGIEKVRGTLKGGLTTDELMRLTRG